MKYTQKKLVRGETLAETVIALTILAIGITFSGTIMASSLSNINTSKNRVIAVNIAREGIEAVRNIRDTNWLKFSSNRRNCWNHQPQTTPDTCDGSNPIEVGDYIIYKDENHRWRLRPYEKINNFENSQLHLVDIDPSTDTNGDGENDNDEDMYNHLISEENSALNLGDDPLGRTYAAPTFFKRVISIDYLTNDGNLVRTNPLLENHNRMEITSHVSWSGGDNSYFSELKTHLTDYFGRENLEN